MNATEVITKFESSKPRTSKKKYNGKQSENPEEKPEHTNNVNEGKERIANNISVTNDLEDVTSSELKKTKNKLLCIYDKEKLLELRSAPASLQKPECLREDFFNRDGIWDPEAWHKSNCSRSASPAVDGKTVVVEGKKMDLVDDNIQLAPHRGSFKQGCHVQADSEKTGRLGPRTVFEKKSRLTGRAAGQRRTVENSYEKEEKHRLEQFPQKDGDKLYDHEHYKKTDYRRKRNDSFHNDRTPSQRSEKPYITKKDLKGGDPDDENLPEWMTEGPTTNSFEFTGFEDLEEEKKAYTKRKKKVRISPDVHKQEEERKKEKQMGNESIKEKERQKVNSEKNKLQEAKIPDNNKSDAEVPDEKQKETSSKFDINEFFNEVDYYPPCLFQEDNLHSDGVRSRFTQWFQAHHQRSRSNSATSSGSRPGSAIGSLIPDEVITGVRKSPLGPASYFTPIQPAPALVSAAASAHAVQTSNILNIIQKRKKSQEDIKANLEIKGRLSLHDLENDNVDKVNQTSSAATSSDENTSAFNMLIMSMKETGQLPDKPAPVVTGLPGHLLPQPPKRTSPTFEKLKLSLNRSPSPAQLQHAVTTLAEVISANPSLQQDLAVDQLETILSPIFTPPEFQHSSFLGHSQLSFETKPVDSPKEPTTQQQKRLLPTAFTPTSVLKQMYNEKQRDSPVLLSQVVPGLLSDRKTLSLSNNEASTPDRSDSGGSFLFHSAPTTPKNQINLTNGIPPHSSSMPTTPDHGFNSEPPAIHRINAASPLSLPGEHHHGSAFTPTMSREHVLMSPSANQKHSIGVIGSGLQRSGDNRLLNSLDFPPGCVNPKLAPGNGATCLPKPLNLSLQNESGLAPGSNISKSLFQTIPQLAQQQLLRPPQLLAQVKQVQQQQKLQQIANLANQQKMLQQKQQVALQGKQLQFNSVGSLLPDPHSTGAINAQQLRTPAEHRLQQQQQQRQQIQAYQQQQSLQQQQQLGSNFRNNSFRGARTIHQPAATNSPLIPIPLKQPTLPLNHPAGMQNMTTQALVRQQLLTSARFIAQAQLLQQQPQVLQAALMAQAALARGHVQAHAAMMLNPRNIQAMAEQMGIRPPQNNKAIPTPMVTASNQQVNNLSKPASATKSPMDSDLSKWFSPDVLQKIQDPGNLSNAKVLSVEELEQQAQRSS